jgi:DNA-binding protein YbaB
MFDNMKMMAALAGLMKNKDKLRAAGERVKEKAQGLRITADAGSGAARATVNGAMKVLNVELSPALVMGMAADQKTHELAGSLIAEAVNEALRQAQGTMKGFIDEEAKELGFEGGLPGIPGLTS